MANLNLTVPDFYRNQFDNDWNHLAQQKTARYRPYVMSESFSGESKSFNFVGSRQMREITQRMGKTRHVEGVKAKRWMYMRPFDDAVRFDEFDVANLSPTISPQNAEIAEMGFAYGRLVDQIIIDATLANAREGERGEVSTPLPNDQIIPVNHVTSGVAVNSGLTLGKLIAIKSRFGTNEETGQNSDMKKKVCLGITQAQLDDLLINVEQIQNSDYAAVKALVMGEVNDYMGMHFIRSEQWPIDQATGIRTIAAWTSDAICFAESPSKQTYLDVLPEYQHSLQARVTARLGAVRKRDTGVVACYCDESA